MGKIAMLSGRLATENALKTLHPKFARRCCVLYENLATIHEAGRLKYRLEIFEGFRHYATAPRKFRVQRLQGVLGGETATQHVVKVDWLPKVSRKRGLGLPPTISAWRLTSFRISRPKKARCWDAHPVGTGRKLPMKLGKYSRSKRRSQA